MSKQQYMRLWRNKKTNVHQEATQLGQSFFLSLGLREISQKVAVGRKEQK